MEWLSGPEQARVLTLIELEGFFEVGNQVMLFSVRAMPAWLAHLASSLPVHHFPQEVRTLLHSPILHAVQMIVLEAAVVHMTGSRR